MLKKLLCLMAVLLLIFAGSVLAMTGPPPPMPIPDPPQGSGGGTGGGGGGGW